MTSTAAACAQLVCVVVVVCICTSSLTLYSLGLPVGTAVLLTESTPSGREGALASGPEVLVMAVDYAISADLVGQHVQRQHRQGHDEHQDPRKQPLSCFLPIHKKILLLLPVRREEGGDDLHLATGCRAARAPFRSVALRHRLSPAVPFSVQLLFCEPHRYLRLPIFYVRSIPDSPKTQGDFQKYIRY
mgnify:CR=1 FL=1